jgi:hypothetical protein
MQRFNREAIKPSSLRDLVIATRFSRDFVA